MPSTLNRLTALIYLTALAFTSMPITVGLLGWCPCGCLPVALVYQQPSDDSSQSRSPGEEHQHDSQHCRGCHGMPYCPIVVDPPFTEWADAGPLAVEPEEQLPPHHVIRLIRPPRA